VRPHIFSLAASHLPLVSTRCSRRRPMRRTMRQWASLAPCARTCDCRARPTRSRAILAMLGTAIGASVTWALPFILFAVYFIYSARREEGFMVAQFPDQYPP